MTKKELSKMIWIKIVITHVTYIVLIRTYRIVSAYIEKDFCFPINVRLLCSESTLLLGKTYHSIINYYPFLPLMTREKHSAEDTQNAETTNKSMNQGIFDDSNMSINLIDLPNTCQKRATTAVSQELLSKIKLLMYINYNSE